MELKGKYNFDYGYLESNVTGECREALEKLRNSKGLRPSLEILKDIFESLEGSHPGLGKLPEWIGDLTLVYRDAGKIYREILEFYPEQTQGILPEERDLHQRISSLEKIFS